MKVTSTWMPGMIFRLSLFCWIDPALPGAARAAWPSHSNAVAQPVLVSALAFTSLVLFLVYMYSRRQGTTKTVHRPAAPGRRENPGGPETDRALETLFDRHRLPMAKLSLDGSQVMDATPALFASLGYEKSFFLKHTGRELGLFPHRDRLLQEIMGKGWAEVETRMPCTRSGKSEPCRVLYFVIHSGKPPFILSIVSGLRGKPVEESLPGFIWDLLDRRTFIQ